MVENRYGRIINISSTSALGNRGQANYATAKAGLQGFTKTLAIELGKYGITANSVAPGFIETDMTKETARRLGISFEDLIQASVSKSQLVAVGNQVISQMQSLFLLMKNLPLSTDRLYMLQVVRKINFLL